MDLVNTMDKSNTVDATWLTTNTEFDIRNDPMVPYHYRQLSLVSGLTGVTYTIQCAKCMQTMLPALFGC